MLHRHAFVCPLMGMHNVALHFVERQEGEAWVQYCRYCASSVGGGERELYVPSLCGVLVLWCLVLWRVGTVVCLLCGVVCMLVVCLCCAPVAWCVDRHVHSLTAARPHPPIRLMHLAWCPHVPNPVSTSLLMRARLNHDAGVGAYAGRVWSHTVVTGRAALACAWCCAPLPPLPAVSPQCVAVHLRGCGRFRRATSHLPAVVQRGLLSDKPVAFDDAVLLSPADAPSGTGGVEGAARLLPLADPPAAPTAWDAPPFAVQAHFKRAPPQALAPGPVCKHCSAVLPCTPAVAGVVGPTQELARHLQACGGFLHLFSLRDVRAAMPVLLQQSTAAEAEAEAVQYYAVTLTTAGRAPARPPQFWRCDEYGGYACATCSCVLTQRKVPSPPRGGYARGDGALLFRDFVPATPRDSEQVFFGCPDLRCGHDTAAQDIEPLEAAFRQLLDFGPAPGMFYSVAAGAANDTAGTGANAGAAKTAGRRALQDGASADARGNGVHNGSATKKAANGTAAAEPAKPQAKGKPKSGVARTGAMSAAVAWASWTRRGCGQGVVLGLVNNQVAPSLLRAADAFVTVLAKHTTESEVCAMGLASMAVLNGADRWLCVLVAWREQKLACIEHLSSLDWSLRGGPELLVALTRQLDIFRSRLFPCVGAVCLCSCGCVDVAVCVAVRVCLCL